jgi:hypothetical protein
LKAFEIEGGIIEDPLIVTSSEFLGDIEGNIATITFTPATTLPESKGAIEIEIPEWATLYDSSLS